jgi:hypothetical protein
VRSCRRIGELVVVVVLVSAGAGCGGGGTSSSSTDIGSTTIPTAALPSHVPTQVPTGQENMPLCKTGQVSTHANPCTHGTPSVETTIVNAWERFFNGATPIAQRIALLAGGDRFAATIRSLSQNPLASKTSATVKSVTITGPTTATVTFSIYIAGVPALTNVKGTAVLENSSWLVDAASLCRLLALEGSTPSACQPAGSKP